MAPREQLTTEDYTHEEAIARIDELEDGIEAALEQLADLDWNAAIKTLEDALGEEEDGPDDEDDDDDFDDD